MGVLADDSAVLLVDTYVVESFIFRRHSPSAIINKRPLIVQLHPALHQRRGVRASNFIQARSEYSH